MKFGSLFAGIGGFDLGLERAGMECAWQVEIDSYATRVLERHWPDVQRYSDIRLCGRHNLETVDVICGGFPCQDVSNAGGGRTGLDGHRSGLWFEFFRIICELRPRYVIVENVAALLVRGFDRVLGNLASVGYDAEWRVFSACEMGFPHSRERLFLVAYPASLGLKKPVLGDCPAISRRTSTTSIRCKDWLFSQVDYSDDMAETWGQEILGENQSILLRVVDGVPRAMDINQQLKGYGNAIVPQIAEWIGRRILEI